MLADAGDMASDTSRDVKAADAHKLKEVAVPVQLSSFSTRMRDPLSTLEQYVVDTATRHNMIVEAAWWQAQCYLV